MTATLLGKTSTPIAVELVDWQDGAHASSEAEGKTAVWPAAVWSEPGGVVGMADGGFASVAIDKVTADEIHGRVFAWTRDAAKSLIAGAFVAKNCHIKP